MVTAPGTRPGRSAGFLLLATSPIVTRFGIIQWPKLLRQ